MIGILSDAHGNIYAFRQAINCLLGLGVRELVFLGDSVGYIPSTAVLHDIFKFEPQISCTLGNHEKMLLDGSLDLKRDEIYKLSLVKSNLSEELLSLIKTWPDHIIATLNDKKILFIHGNPHDFLNGYVYPDTDLSNFETEYDYIFMGHTHRPFIKMSGTTCFVNVGSCGMSRDDGRYGSVAIFDPISGGVEIIRFDITEATKSSLEEVGLVHEMVSSLYNRRSENIFGRII